VSDSPQNGVSFSKVKFFMKNNFPKMLFWLSLLAFGGLTALWFRDLLKGDANGIVANIPLSPFIWITGIASLVLGFWVSFKQKMAWLQNILVFGLMAFLTIALLEWVCGILLVKQAAKMPKIEGPSHSMVMDSVLGYKPSPDTTHTGVRTKDGQVIYNISYKTDANNLRITPVANTKPSKYALFFGCSMTFGEGVQSDETIPYYFSKADSSYKSYNFAYSGYGPHQALARLETNTLRTKVSENQGVGYYIYINDHVNRVLGTLTNFSYNGGNAPYYHEVGNELKHDGLFKDGRKLKTWIFGFLLKSNILKFFKIGYPFKITDQDYALTADVLSEASKAYKKQFGNDNFYVVIYPTTIDSGLIIRLLKERNVQVLDYSKLFDPTQKGYAIPYDEHPTAIANTVLVKQLTKDLVSKLPQETISK
jgi:hypothetical protein